LDRFYENDAYLHNADDRLYHDDNNDARSDGSVGEVTETTISEATPEALRYTALVKTMSEKQQGISWAFAGMVQKMSKTVKDGKSDSDEKADKKHADIVERATYMAKKQARISRQLEKLVERLEMEARQKDLESARLKREMRKMKEQMKKLKKEAATGSSEDSAASHSEAKSGVKSAPVVGEKDTAEKKLKKTHSSRHARPKSLAHPPRSSPKSAQGSVQSLNTDIFAIKEISFTTTTIDVSEVNEDLDEDLDTGDNVRMML
jgi:hypothetical protein